MEGEMEWGRERGERGRERREGERGGGRKGGEKEGEREKLGERELCNVSLVVYLILGPCPFIHPSPAFS